MYTESLYEHYRLHPFVETDTRMLRPGAIFFALKGPRFNGNLFAAAAIERGASLVVTDEDTGLPGSVCLRVPDSLRALQDLAARHRNEFSIPFIAITGTNGKTTTKELLTTVLSARYKTYATEGNLNNHIGVPLTLLRIREDAEIAVIEMGASHQGEIASYCRIARPTHGIITNCGKAHLEGFGSEAGVRAAKGELYAFIRETGGTIFRNNNLGYLEDMANGIVSQITYGNSNADYTGTPSQEHMFLSMRPDQPASGQIIHTRLVGMYNFANVMAAYAAGMHFRVPAGHIRQALESYRPDNNRSQRISRGSNTVIMDAYNANPDSMREAILNFAAAPVHNKILWIGAMKELGADSMQEHRLLTEMIRRHNWEEVLLVGSEFAGCEGSFKRFDDAPAAAAYIRDRQPEHASILIKGSRSSRMEVLLDALF